MIDITVPVIASLLWSLNPAVISKWAKNSPPLLFTSIRALLAASFLLVVLALLRTAGLTLGTVAYNTNSLNNTTVLLLIVLSAITGPAIGDAFYVKAIQKLGGSLAVVLSYTYIFFTGLFALLLHIEYPTTWMILGGVLAFTGVVVAVSSNSFTFRITGIAYALLAGVNWGLATVLIRLVRDYVDPVTLSIIRLAIVFLVMIPLSILFREAHRLSRDLLIATSITGILGWGVGMVLFIYSIYRIGPSLTAIATALTPVLSQVTTRIIASERISPRVFLGSFLVMLGIISASL
ncbi:MAG: DMT family transporter [Desulfurococcaceae archaeon]